MIDLDKLYEDGDQAAKWNEAIARMARETELGQNLNENYNLTGQAIAEANDRIEQIKNDGGNYQWLITLRDVVAVLRNHIAKRLFSEN